MTDALVTVAGFNTAAEAHILRGRLEEEGIRATVADEDTVNMAWHLGQAVGGVKVQVAAEDTDRARAVIAQLDARAKEAPDTAEDADPRDLTARRALRAAFLGILIPPLQLYSLWLVGRLAFTGDGASTAMQVRMALSLLLDLWVVAWLVALLHAAGGAGL